MMSKKTKSIIAIIIAIIFLIIFVLPVLNFFSNVNAMTLSEAQKNTQKTQQALKETREKKKVTADDLKKIALDQKNLNDDMNDTKDKLDGLNGQLAQEQQAINQAQADLDSKNDVFNKRLQFIYEHGNNSYIEILFQAKNISDFFHRYELISQLIEYDKQVIDKVTAAKKILEEQKAATEKTKAEQVEQYSVQEQQKLAIDENEQEKQAILDKLSQDEAEQEKQVADQKKQEDTIRSQMVVDSNKVNVVYTGEKFAWPIPGYYTITSPFGTREHPTLKVVKLHTGTDISAPTGVPAYAAAGGVVTQAGYNTAYGNYVVINHGGGYSTLYGHASKLCVTKGQTVAKGDLILKVGSTGYSTGSHLHFEVVLNGSPVNPMSFF